jgi:hypothetical protein
VTRATLALAVLLASPLARSSDAVQCPDSIRVAEKLAAAADGWTEGASDEPHRLAGITLFDGKPEERASLVGEERVLSKAKLQVTWPLAKGREYWLSCSYASTGVVLSRRLPEAVRSCTATYSRNVRVAGLPELLRLDCK